MLKQWALVIDLPDAIPAIWAMGYGAAICAAGMFSVREVRIFGVVELVSGAVAFVFMSYWPVSLYVLAVTLGLYHIIFGVWLMCRYGQ